MTRITMMTGGQMINFTSPPPFPPHATKDGRTESLVAARQYWLDHKSMKLNFQTWFPFHLPIVSNVKYLNPQNIAMSTIYFQSMNLEFDGVNKFQLCESRFGRKSNKSWESPFAGCIFQFSNQLVGNNFSVVSLSNFLSCVIFQIFQSNGWKQFLSCVTFI